MRETKRVKKDLRQSHPLTRAELKRRADLELHAKLAKFGTIFENQPKIQTGSKVVDERIRTRIGDYKGDPTLGMWHGHQNGPIKYGVGIPPAGDKSS